MPDIFYLISKWWKQMLLLTGLSLLVVAIVVFMQPERYLSVATALPASTFQSDKGSVFNGNIQELYPSIGEADDLDRIVGTGRLDTAFLAVTREFNLWDHYKTEEKGDAALHKATLLLKKYSKVIKSDYGELKVRVWDTDRNLAARLANALIDELEEIHSGLQTQSNQHVLQTLIAKRDTLRKLSDSMHVNASLRTEEIDQYDKLILQYQLMVDTRPFALLVVERARAAEYPDTPKRVLILSATALLGFLFSLLVALILEKRKQPKS